MSKKEENIRGLFAKHESLTDEEYETSNCMSYSKIKDVYDNASAITRKRTKSNAEWLIFGTIVDIMLTETEKDIKNKIIINDDVPTEQFLKMSEYILDNDLDIEDLTDIQIEKIYIESGSNVIWKNDTKRAKLILNCSSYIELLENNRDKYIINSSVYDEALKVANVFKQHEWTRELFLTEEEQIESNVEIYYQFKIQYIYANIRCQSKFDIVLIDHNLKTITPIDIKTGSDYPRMFIRNALYKYKYGYQGALYKEGLTKFVRNLKEFDKYTIENFRFVYVSRLVPFYPITLQMAQSCHNEFKVDGIYNHHYDLPALDDLFMEATYYIEQIDKGHTNIDPFDLTPTWGEIVMESTTFDRELRGLPF